MSSPSVPAAASEPGVVELRAPDGARARIALHGAHLLSWAPAGAGEQLYLSPRSESGPGQAIRGGVPVIFPQFAARGPLPRHGFARTRAWQLVAQEQGRDDALAVLRLVDDAATRAVWPQAFELELSVRVSGATLEIELACENRGDAAFAFTAALHSYFSVSELGNCTVEGLEGLEYEDSAAGGAVQRQREMLLLPGAAGLDRIYRGVGARAIVLGDDLRRLAIAQQGFDDAVVWNPGEAGGAKIADMPAEDWRRMLCVEAATVARPVTLAPGESWAGLQSITHQP
ncbi:MAG: D-hexose-6-phosphate mutarotase [Pelomonas sp.]|nr:D-hexose-6-phosphate mutarotase [Roseateles sp.]